MSWTITPNWSPADADAAAYITAVETADGQALENGVKVAIDNFVLGCKQDGIWTAIKASCILAGARTLAGCLVPLVGTAPTNNNFVAGDYNRKTGLVGDGSSKYLSSNRTNNADPQNSKHLSVYVTTVATSGASNYPEYIGDDINGISKSGTTHIGRLNNNSSTLFVRCQGTEPSGGYDSLLNSGSATGFIAINRANASGFDGRANSITTSFTKASSAPTSGNISVFYGNISGTYANARIAFYSIGTSLDLALLDTRVTTLMNAFAAAIP